MIRFAHYAARNKYPRPWVAISNGVPEWGEVDEHRKDLAPDWSDVQGAKAGTMTREEFTRRYWRKIETIWNDHREAIGELQLKGGATCFCYEKPGEFCHRRILAAFLVRRGFKVELDGKPIGESFRILNCTASCCGKQLSDCDCIPF